MKNIIKRWLLITILLQTICCQKALETKAFAAIHKNEITHAKGFSIHKYGNYSILKVTNPWPNASQSYTYILKRKGAIIPDSLSKFATISVPVKKIIVTSTTHIPSLEMLGVEKSLIGFPNLEYISSPNVRARIDAGYVREVGSTQNLNTEIILNLGPDLIVAHGIDNNNPALDNLERSGLKVMMNGDWNEQTALGKAEWIKFFGALYGLDEKAKTIFGTIQTEYEKTIKLASSAKQKPTVLSGAIYENHWYLPQGDSWGALLIAQAGGNYLWKETKGTGSLSLSVESVLERAENANFWIGPGQFTTLAEMGDANPHYKRFAAFRNKSVYSYSIKKGPTGGIIYFELAPNRPDLVIKDLVKIFHPELLPDHQLYFFEKVN
ncbi:MAG TPA: ABC transporter substrate-binding protein [Flavobacterium sp.]|jgi:iron complex transport system substrate-binding protein